MPPQGRRQDFVKGRLTRGENLCRRPYGQGSRGRHLPGVWWPLEAHNHMFMEWLVQLPFSFDFSFLFCLSFSLPLILSLLFSLFILVFGGGGYSPLSHPCLRHCLPFNTKILRSLKVCSPFSWSPHLPHIPKILDLPLQEITLEGSTILSLHTEVPVSFRLAGVIPK